MSEKFIIDGNWQVLFNDLNISLHEVLKRADLPEALFASKQPSLTTEQYFRLWDGMAATMDNSLWPLQVGQAITPEVFSPPLFATFCSPNLETAMQRLSQFKRLIGPMVLPLERTEQGMKVSIEVTNTDLPMPKAMIAMELVFLVNLARLATRENIVPLAVTAMMPMEQAYTDYFGITPKQGKTTTLYFAEADLTKPFLTENAAMWNFFEPELRQRLSQLEAKASFAHRVKSALLELLPSGESSVDQVANKLAVSRRTLQRKLQAEDTSFQHVLQTVRTNLAKHYLKTDNISGIEVSLLLGFESYNSFIRAFHQWTGSTPEEYRNCCRMVEEG